MEPVTIKPPIDAQPRDPASKFHASGAPLGPTLLAFWRWANSNLVSTAFRGNLAEFLVWCAVDGVGNVRATWDEVDVITKDGLLVEVKSAAYLQDWGQARPSRIGWGIAPSRAWDRARGQRADEPKRHSQVYVLCLLHNQDRDTLDPMDVDQWTFFVVATGVINRDFPNQKTLALSRIDQLVRAGDVRKVSFQALPDAVRWAAS